MSKGSNNKKKKQNLTSLLVAGLMVVIALISLKPTLFTPSSILLSTTNNQNNKQATPRVTTIFKQVKSYTFNPDGKLSSTLFSPRIEEDQNKLQLIISPHYTTYKHSHNDNTTTDEIWKISADEALYNPNFHTSIFDGNVLINATQDASLQSPIELTTATLTVDHQQQTAYSDAGVFILSPQAKIQSQSIKIDLQSQSLALKNQVKSQYAPKP